MSLSKKQSVASSTWAWHALSQAHGGLVSQVQVKAARAQLNLALVLQLATEHGVSLPLMLDLLVDLQPNLRALAQGQAQPQRVAAVQSVLQRFQLEREQRFRALHRDVTLLLPDVLALEDNTPHSQMTHARREKHDAIVLAFMRRIDTLAHQLVDVTPPSDMGSDNAMDLLSLAWNTAQTSASLDVDCRLALYALEADLAHAVLNQIASSAQNEGIFLASQWQAVLRVTPQKGIHQEVMRLALAHAQTQANRYWKNPQWDNWPIPFPDFADAAAFAAAPQNSQWVDNLLKPTRLQHDRSLSHAAEDPALLKEKWRLLGFIGQTLKDIAQLPTKSKLEARRVARLVLHDLVEQEFEQLTPNLQALDKKAAWDQYTEALNHLSILRSRIPTD